MGIVPHLLVLLLSAGTATGTESGRWKRAVAGAEVDWSTGTITAQGGAAADLRMPNANAARPGAERRARAAAVAMLEAALGELGIDSSLEKAALARAAVARTEYQSNGGVVLWLGLRFSDIPTERAAPKPLRVTSAPFKLAPGIVGASRSVRAASATYRPAAECPADAIAVKRDGKGRLVLPPSASDLVDSFAGASVVIYLEKPEP